MVRLGDLKPFRLFWCIVLPALAGWLTACRPDKPKPAGDGYQARPKHTLTFNKDIAPIVFTHCSGCHRPNESAPFSLLSYGDVQRHAKQIAEVTQSRFMPPWLPEPAVVHFEGERRLSVEQIGLIQQWVEEGTKEGDAKDLPGLPIWNEKWALGPPDLVLKPEVAFRLAAEGRDVYRNLVVPIPVSARKYVRGLIFRPNSPAVHHAFLRFDKTGRTKELDGRDGQPGFYGLHTPTSAESPVTFASWQPGKTPRFYPEDTAWLIETNSFLVLQLHLQPIGKEEPIAPEVAFYFAERPGTALVFKLPLNDYKLEIPPGVSNYLGQDSFVLPCDLEVRAVLPHAHYLCRSMKGYAELPGGGVQWLMYIKEWDFNWQGDYVFQQPVRLPKGSRVVMEYQYDNTTNNVRNPQNPPELVRYGMETRDEMGELWLQVVMKTPQDLAALTGALKPRFLQDAILSNEMMLRKNPRDAKALCEIGSSLLLLGRTNEARQKLEQSIVLDPNYDEARYFHGLVLRMSKNLPAARGEFEAALRLNPRHGRACGNLGLVLTEMGDYLGAARTFGRALEIDPGDAIARDMLARLKKVVEPGAR